MTYWAHGFQITDEEVYSWTSEPARWFRHRCCRCGRMRFLARLHDVYVRNRPGFHVVCQDCLLRVLMVLAEDRIASRRVQLRRLAAKEKETSRE